MPGSPIRATIDALRATLADIEHLEDSEGVIQLKGILLRRIAQLESLGNSSTAAKPIENY